MINPLVQIIERQRQVSGTSFMQVFAGDDKKQNKNIYQKFFDLSKSTETDVNEYYKGYNLQNSFGVFININPLNKPKRIKENIKKIIYIFIDLDNADENHNQLIKDKLESMKITYSYNCKSGHGFHFLVPIELNSSKESIVKGFLTYLKNNICDKVDIATYTNERLFRIPESLHHKDNESKQLITLHSHFPSNDEVTNNNIQIQKYVEIENENLSNIQYQNTIKRDDIFFKTILGDSKKWDLYYKYLNKAENRNDVFVKNLGAYCSQEKNSFTDSLASEFLNGWESIRVGALNGWISKNLHINYYELMAWSKKHNLVSFIDILEEQMKRSFLDEYEFYYLEDEKPENNCLLYYPEKKYSVQKSINEVVQNVYYDCRERGIDLVKEFNLDCLDKWHEMSFSKQYKIILEKIKGTINEENRIRNVFNINYKPTNDKFIVYNNKRFINIFSNTSLWNYYKKLDKYHFPLIKELLQNLTGNDEKSYMYLIKWLAWIIQNPTDKLPTAIILQGRQGSGKGTFKSLILDNIFGENCQEINQTHLESSFNEYLLGKQIIVANEVMHNENRQTLPNVLKNLVTDEEITISRKFRKEITGKNYTHWIFCTNSDNPIKIDEDDRRYSVFYSEKMYGGGIKAAKFFKKLRTNIDYELKEFICYLKDIEVCFEDVHEPIMTNAKEEIIELNKDSISSFLDELKKYASLDHLFDIVYPENNVVPKYLNDANTLIDTDSIYNVYVMWCKFYNYRGVYQKQNFGKKMSVKGIKSFPRKIKENDTMVSVKAYKVSDLEKYMSKVIVEGEPQEIVNRGVNVFEE